MSSTWWRAAGYLWGGTGGWSAPQSYSTASSNTRLWVCLSGPQLHIHRGTCRQVTHKRGDSSWRWKRFSWPTSPPHHNIQMIRLMSTEDKWENPSVGVLQVDALSTVNTRPFSESLEICVRVSQRSALLIDWYFHYGCRVVRRMLICLGVLQV